ncbi:MAG: hypothetical protein GY725_19380 [bacterium]|nr:hypothetical protein [bacterium]
MERVYEDQHPEDSIRKPSGLRSSGESAEAAAPASAEDASEVFELRPLSQRQAMARVQKRGPARFRFVTDGD